MSDEMRRYKTMAGPGDRSSHVTSIACADHMRHPSSDDQALAVVCDMENVH